jgi:hypothetical protein
VSAPSLPPSRTLFASLQVLLGAFIEDATQEARQSGDPSELLAFIHIAQLQIDLVRQMHAALLLADAKQTDAEAADPRAAICKALALGQMLVFLPPSEGGP